MRIHGKGKRISRKDRIRSTLFQEQHGLCCACGKAFNHLDRDTIEHVVPRSWGGTDTSDNWALTHLSCNQGHVFQLILMLCLLKWQELTILHNIEIK